MKKLSIYSAAAFLACAVAFIGSPATAGRVGGPGAHCDIVQTCRRDVYHVRFRACQRAIIRAHAVDDDIDMKVFDQDGNLVAEDVQTDDTPVCSFVPGLTQTFTVEIINNERHDVSYTLQTN